MSETKIANYISTETVTGYGLIKALNKVLKDLDPSIKELPTPMGYTYLKKGYVVEGVKEIKSCTKDQAVAWIEKYLTKRFASQIQEAVTVEPQYVGFENE